MRFRRLKLSGFKSFVEPAELRIEPGLTGVVGPNGCGKSNLLEAIRWVMGEGSPKSLRGGGMEDVIFAGTATRPARDFAEVSLLIERSAAEADNDSQGESEVSSETVGEMVMEALRALDDVAYVRFASVYRNFREAKDFEAVLDELSGEESAAAARK